MRAVISAAVVLLAGCATEPANIGPEMEVAGQCLSDQARALDDRISGADIVARAVVEACGPELRTAYRKGTQGQTGAYAQGFSSEFWAQAFNAARRYVLQIRAERVR